MVFLLENLVFMRLFGVAFSFLSGLENWKRKILERNNYEQAFLNPLVYLMILKKQLVSMHIPAPFDLESCIAVFGVVVWCYKTTAKWCFKSNWKEVVTWTGHLEIPATKRKSKLANELLVIFEEWQPFLSSEKWHLKCTLITYFDTFRQKGVDFFTMSDLWDEMP